MARKVSAGIAGGAAVAGLQAFTTTLTSASNLDITVEPAGTGRFLINGNAQLLAQGDLRFADADSSNWVAFQSPATVASNVTWTLPAIDGSNNQVLTTNGNGLLSWTLKDISLTDQTTSGTIHYPTLTTLTSGVATVLNTSSTKLSFVPSTGTLFTTVLTGGTGASNTLTLRSTSNATKGRIVVDESTVSTSTSTGALTVSGGVGVAGQITATTIVETSSIVFKENINPITGALNKITSLTGVTYDRKDGSIKNESGLIAEEVEKIIPNLVTRDEHGRVYGLQYTKMVAYLIESIKELKQEIDSLKGK
jgi:hypothetical protein